jgi:hypothetical protein
LEQAGYDKIVRSCRESRASGTGRFATNLLAVGDLPIRVASSDQMHQLPLPRREVDVPCVSANDGCVQRRQPRVDKGQQKAVALGEVPAGR